MHVNKQALEVFLSLFLFSSLRHVEVQTVIGAEHWLGTAAGEMSCWVGRVCSDWLH